jgi:hypothetical protein
MFEKMAIVRSSVNSNSRFISEENIETVTQRITWNPTPYRIQQRSGSRKVKLIFASSNAEIENEKVYFDGSCMACGLSTGAYGYNNCDQEAFLCAEELRNIL